ncbi:hypothetical protein V9T40_000906 [Parthenolecanium corni]|uniref:Uncharacterized protein n=1 Tax=Parthenolecanium corni TaxID=536013 RepID=A0AAN9TAF2_9HEMI
MRDDAAELVKYIKTSFLLINPKLEDIQKSQTEIQALSEGSTPNTEILLEGSLPETQSDGSEKKIPEPPKNMFRSTAMNLLENLIGMIANANPNLEAGEKEKLHQPIDSFILTVPAEGYVNPNIEAKAKEKLHQPIDSFILTVPAEGDVNPNIEAEAIEELHQPMDSFILTVPADGDVYINIEAEAEEKLHQPIDSFILTVPTEGDVNPNIEAKAKEKLHQSIDSFIQTVPLEGEVLKRWLFIEISYSEMLKLYPEKDIIPANSESSWLS